MLISADPTGIRVDPAVLAALQASDDRRARFMASAARAALADVTAAARVPEHHHLMPSGPVTRPYPF